MTWKYLIEGPWIVFVVYWAVGAFKTRRTERSESFASRYGILFLEIAGFVLLFSDYAEIGTPRASIFAAYLRCLESPALRSPGPELRWRCGHAGIWGGIGAPASRSKKIIS